MQRLIAGQPALPFAFFYNTDIRGWREAPHLRSQVELARQSDVHLYSMSFRTPHSQPAGVETNWAWADRYLDAFIDVDPKATFLLRLYPGPDRSWSTYRNIPAGEFSRYADGTTGPISLASDWFWGPADADIERVIRHYEASRFGPRIAAYHIGGPNIEMFGDEYRTKGPDYSLANQTRFRRWLADRYATDAALATAWGQPGLTRKAAGVPRFEAGRFPMRQTPESGTVAVFYERPAEQHWIDYSAYCSDLTADRLLAWAALVRRATAGRKPAMFFYGYTFELPGSFSGHGRLGRVLASHDVTLLAGPWSYADRNSGGAGSFMSPVDSIAARGKLWFSEDDTRTHCLSDEAIRRTNMSFFGTGGHARAETIGVLDRSLAAATVHRAGLWWMDLSGQGAFGDPGLWKLLDARRRLCDEQVENRERYCPDVAVLVDEDSRFHIKSDYDAPRALLVDLRDAAAHSGAAVGYYLLDDFVSGLVPPCKVYVFANAFALDDAHIKAVRARLERERATALWAYAPGIVGPTGLDVARCAELTGIRLARHDGRQGSAGVRNAPLTGLRWGRPVGVSPRLVVDDPRADSIATYRSDGAVSSARRVVNGSPSFFFGDMSLTADVLRVVFMAAGVHVWTTGDEVVHTDGRLLAVHAGRAGRVHIACPSGRRIVPVTAPLIPDDPTAPTTATAPDAHGRAPADDPPASDYGFAKGQTRWFRVVRART